MNEISSSGGIVLLIVLGMVIVINLGLLFLHRNRSAHDQADILRRFAQSARQPFKQEDRQLQELAEKVKPFKEDANRPTAED